MTEAILAEWPNGAALLKRLGRHVMDVILHLGAHRTASTTFQHYVRDNHAAMTAQDIGYWGPGRSRKKIFPGLFRTAGVTHARHPARRAEGRIGIMLQQARDKGLRQLLVSDENLMGTCAHNLRKMSLYPAIGDRLARINAAFDGHITRIMLTIRPQDDWWASAAALSVSRGHMVPTARRCAAIADSPRSWQDVITDMACAAPNAQIVVMPFDAVAARPDLVLSHATGLSAKPDPKNRHLNASAPVEALRAILTGQGADPDQMPHTSGRWQPFTATERAQLRERYADDMHWLTAGAGGLATLTEDLIRTRADTSLPPEQKTKGQQDDNRQGHMAQHR